MARSLGDYYLKKERIAERQWHYPSVERETVGTDGFVDDVVSAIPYVQYYLLIKLMYRHFKLKGEDRFIVIATDGLWEVINPKACISIINQLSKRYHLDVGEWMDGLI